MNTFILEILSLDCHILLQSSRSIMNMSPIILGDLGILEISDFHLNISDKNLIDLAYSGLSPHLKETLERHTFLTLAKSCKWLWITKAELRSLEASLGAMVSLGKIVTLTWSNIVASHRMTRKPTYA
jgi:hypothetical protein